MLNFTTIKIAIKLSNYSLDWQHYNSTKYQLLPNRKEEAIYHHVYKISLQGIKKQLPCMNYQAGTTPYNTPTANCKSWDYYPQINEHCRILYSILFKGT